MGVGNRKRLVDPWRGAINTGAVAAVAWTGSDGHVHTSVADGRCCNVDFSDVQRSRRPADYRHRRNYEGYYWCSGTGDRIWYESMVEYSALMDLDHRCHLTAVTAQPFCILFPDGTRHYPDFLTVHSSGQRILYDVRPVERIDDRALEQFAKTESLCSAIGWGYHVHPGVLGVPRHNLEWLAGYRHPVAAPSDSERALILRLAASPIALSALAESVSAEVPSRAMPWIYHLMWKQLLIYDDSRPLGWRTQVRSDSDG